VKIRHDNLGEGQSVIHGRRTFHKNQNPEVQLVYLHCGPCSSRKKRQDLNAYPWLGNVKGLEVLLVVQFIGDATNHKAPDMGTSVEVCFSLDTTIHSFWMIANRPGRARIRRSSATERSSGKDEKMV